MQCNTVNFLLFVSNHKVFTFHAGLIPLVHHQQKTIHKQCRGFTSNRFCELFQNTCMLIYDCTIFCTCWKTLIFDRAIMHMNTLIHLLYIF